MKKFLAFIVAIIITVMSVLTASAETYSFNSTPDLSLVINTKVYSVITPDTAEDDDNAAAVALFSKKENTELTGTEVAAYMAKYDLDFIAISNDGVIKMSSKKLEKKTAVTDFSTFSNAALLEFGEKNFSTDGYSVDVAQIDKTGVKFITVNSNTDAKVSSYLTYRNGYSYTFYFEGVNKVTARTFLSGALLKELELGEKEQSGFSTILIYFGIALLALIILAAIVILIISIIRELRVRHSENDVAGYIKIKRRKF